MKTDQELIQDAIELAPVTSEDCSIMLLRDVTASAGKLESMNVVVFVAKANPYFLEHFECYSGTTDEHIALSNYGLVLVERAIRQVLALAQEWEQSDES